MPVSFVHPEFLWAWAFVLVPVLLHLFGWKRYKTVYFPHVADLRQARQWHRRHGRLRRLLILGCRVAAMILLVAAFAQPVRRGEGAGLARADKLYYSLYLDNSHSMSAPYGVDGSVLAAAKAAAARIVRQWPETAAIQILTNEFQGNMQTFHAPAEALRVLTGVRPSSASRTLDDAAARMQAAAEEQGVPPDAVQRIYISDFQTTVFDGDIGQGGSGVWHPDGRARYLAFTPPSYDDWHIDSVALSQAVSPITGEGELQVWIGRSVSAGGRAERRLQWLADGQAVPARRVALSPGERTCEVWPFRLATPGFHAAELRLEPDSVPYNDRFYLSLYRPPRCRVLHIYGDRPPAAAARRLFGRDSAFIYEAVQFNRLDYAALPAADFVLAEGLSVWPSALTAALGDYLRSGGRLAIVPPVPESDAQAAVPAPAVAVLDAWLQTLVGRSVYGRYAACVPHPRQIRVETAFRHPIWRKAVLNGGSVASARFSAATGASSASEPLTVYGLYELAATETPLWPDFISDYRIGNGRLYLFAAPWEAAYSTFTNHYGFVVCLLGMATEGGGLRPLYVADRRGGYGLPSAGRGADADFNGWRLVTVSQGRPAADTVVYRPPVGAVAEERRLYGLETLPSGHYRLEDASGHLVDLLALNPPASESWQAYRHPQAAADTVPHLVADTSAGANGVSAVSSPPAMPLWKILLIFALLFMGAEAVLLYRKPAV